MSSGSSRFTCACTAARSSSCLPPFNGGVSMVPGADGENLGEHWRPGRTEELLPGRQGRLLFAYLVAQRRHAVTRSELTDALWPQQSPALPSHAPDPSLVSGAEPHAHEGIVRHSEIGHLELGSDRSARRPHTTHRTSTARYFARCTRLAEYGIPKSDLQPVK